jgi:hypothetical protein
MVDVIYFTIEAKGTRAFCGISHITLEFLEHFFEAFHVYIAYPKVCKGNRFHARTAASAMHKDFYTELPVPLRH